MGSNGKKKSQTQDCSHFWVDSEITCAMRFSRGNGDATTKQTVEAARMSALNETIVLREAE